MDVIASILLTLLTVVGVLVAVVLVAPIALRVDGAVDGEALDGRLAVRARWALGVLGLDYALGRGATFRVLGVPVARVGPGGDREAKREKKRRKQARRERRRRRPKKSRGAGWAWRHRRLLQRALLRLLGTLHLRGHVHGVVGLPEPDETAWLDVALRQLRARTPPGLIDVDVDYTDAVLDLEGRVSSWLIPAHPLLVALGLLLSRDGWRAWRAA